MGGGGEYCTGVHYQVESVKSAMQNSNYGIVLFLLWGSVTNVLPLFILHSSLLIVLCYFSILCNIILFLFYFVHQ